MFYGAEWASLSLGIDGRAFHLAEGHAGTDKTGVAVGFQEGGGLFHAGLDLDPLHLAAEVDQAGPVSDPQAMRGRGVHIVIFHQGQLAGRLVLIQRQHGDR
jgi:hypothetical protein